MFLVDLPPVVGKDNDYVTAVEVDEYDDCEFYFWRPSFLPKGRPKAALGLIMEKGVGHCHNQPVHVNVIENHYQLCR
ncbi:hypothetical protein AHZ37_000986 [Salmonella enterica subsp. indica]|uniref:Uncharacterized protein n=1 Tax=Salmonella enterica TaxID=28901 RepID=A0A701ZD60_SALER|nr:hypothetical protein [Salmonella enterica subsp. indica serovar 11:b:e,n,x]EBP3211799.1 hypothetical protein [Salmonella enterica subsp. arizonae]ECC3875443.1 hypothetical protein [Salmonella enterica subsp. indica]ECI8270072.1 hypothetical protein [Salmonella enterica subsp. enterica]EDR2769775.1 hypothetical protein [Salmonella enterica subsp. enterica serovar Oslo]EEC4247923.1 hypothetical protein [Salmonella enterica subsp. diarizonae]EHN2304444.1 hypothetical protein [Salmonella enter